MTIYEDINTGYSDLIGNYAGLLGRREKLRPGRLKTPTREPLSRFDARPTERQPERLARKYHSAGVEKSSYTREKRAAETKSSSRITRRGDAHAEESRIAAIESSQLPDTVFVSNVGISCQKSVLDDGKGVSQCAGPNGEVRTRQTPTAWY
ncbi:hypothetical protein B0H11DRAFT_1911519 [Mycena galericulata]|nr:hypothetical protein B0H11DRAFT_1911519 [Mycena galericulata]